MRWPVLTSLREQEERRGRLAAGEPVQLPARIRRTTTRGWGPWTDGVVHLARAGDKCRWEVENPSALGLPVEHTADVWEFGDVEHVALRDVRFRQEAFYGSHSGSIIVLTADRSTMEIALPPGEIGEALVRLAAGVGPHKAA